MSFFKKLFNPSDEPKIMDWREFTEYFAQTIEAQVDGQLEIEWGSDLEDTTVYLNLGNGANASLYLGNHFARYRENPEELPEIIEQTMTIVVQIGNEEERIVQPENIFPMIKSTVWLDNLAQMYQKDGKDPTEHLCIQPLAGDIALIYMVDMGSSFKSLNRDEWAQAGIENDEMLHTIALENLEHYLRQEHNLGYRHSDNGLYQISLDEVLDASLIVLLEKILDLAELNLAPYPVFAVPARNMLLVCAADNQAALAQMQEIIDDEMADSPYVISSFIYCLKNGQIQLFNMH